MDRLCCSTAKGDGRGVGACGQVCRRGADRHVRRGGRVDGAVARTDRQPRSRAMTAAPIQSAGARRTKRDRLGNCVRTSRSHRAQMERSWGSAA